MAWYNTTGRDQDVIVSSRVRFARNIEDYPNEPKLDAASAREIIGKVKEAVGESYKYVDFCGISETEALSYVEKHVVSPEFAAKKTPHALLENEEKQIDIMVCEEDHLRIQCILAGSALEEAFRRTCEADDIIDEKMNIAFDENLGYLTHCPTNLGTGMRASVMMFLPAVTVNHEIAGLQNQLSKIGLTIRGMRGEGSAADGCLYQISNQITLGITEEETIKKLSDVINQIAKRERTLRQSVKDEQKEYLADKISRSYGTMLYANLMSSSEFLQLYADVRLGIAMGIIDKLEFTDIDGLLVSTMPASIVIENGGKSMSDFDRDKARADFIKKTVR